MTPDMAVRLAELDDEWKLSGACRGRDVNRWYEFDGNPIAEQEVASFCRNACPVVTRCLIWALYLPEVHGVWGGMTEDQRRQLRSQYKPHERKGLLLLDTAV